MQPVAVTVDLIPILLVIGLAISATSLFLAIASKSTARHGISWAISGAVAATGLLLIFLRGAVPDLASILFGNWFLLSGEAMFAYGTSRFIGRRTRLDLVMWALALVCFALAYGVGTDVLVRVTIYTIACSFFAIRTATGFFQAQRTLATLFAGSIATLVGVVELTRAALGFADVISLTEKATMNSFSMLFGVPVSFAIAVGALILQREQIMVLLRIKRIEPVPMLDEIKPNTVRSHWILPTDRTALIAPDGTEVRLTGNEFMVLQKLGEVGDAVDRLTLNTVIGRSAVDPKDRGIDILFSRLRKKCTDAGVELPINSLRGRGYVFLGVLQRV